MSVHPVKVYIYDLTKGLARQLSQSLIGKQLDGVWHTGIVIYNQEFFYGGQGIESCAPGQTILGEPNQREHLGDTEIPSDMFFEYLQDLANTTFRPECYHLLDHNCNTFSNEIANFLTGKNIPSHITSLPHEVMATPFGAMIRPFIDSMQVSPGGGSQMSFTPTQPSIPAAPTAAAAAAPAAAASVQPNSTKSQANQSQTASAQNDIFKEMIKFKDNDILSQFESQRSLLQNALDQNEFRLLCEVIEVLSTKDSSRSLTKLHIKLLGKLLHIKSLSEGKLVGCLLQQCMLCPDIIQILKSDPDKEYLQLLSKFEEYNIGIQEALVKSMCNVITCKDGYSWLMSTDQQQIGKKIKSCENLTVSICTSCVLSDTKTLNNVGASLCHNITRKRLNEELSMELGIALVQLTSKDLDKDTALHTLSALEKCMSTNAEVTSVASVMGLETSTMQRMSVTHLHLGQQIQLMIDSLKAS